MGLIRRGPSTYKYAVMATPARGGYDFVGGKNKLREAMKLAESYRQKHPKKTLHIFQFIGFVE